MRSTFGPEGRLGPTACIAIVIAPGRPPGPDEGVEVARVGHRLQRQRDLERAGHGDVADVVLVDLQSFEFGQAGLGHCAGDGFIETCAHDAQAQALTEEFAHLALVGFLHEVLFP